MPWEYKKGKFSKPSIKTITLWWFIFAGITGVVIFIIGSIIFT